MISNFRPISISSCICRILERIIRDAIQSFLDANLLMNASQQGFSRGRSTLTALLTYSNDICNAIDKGLCVDSAYFDFSKAFDCVRHDYLVYKLSKIGINGPILKWIINYLNPRPAGGGGKFCPPPSRFSQISFEQSKISTPNFQ